ncbi:response regulator [Nostoc flagelliforme]|uniref:response regulator n=1 Tax=Nostoc flagelliforme TaxID=1306274 RepID=UPI0026D5C1DA|nr:response regulator [Nostoc flagelliforme]
MAVDDQADSRDLIKWMLSDFGAEIVVVTSVREAIAALTESPGRYDVLLADIGMPEEDGFSLIRQVRALEALAGDKFQQQQSLPMPPNKRVKRQLMLVSKCI